MVYTRVYLLCALPASLHPILGTMAHRGSIPKSSLNMMSRTLEKRAGEYAVARLPKTRHTAKGLTNTEFIPHYRNMGSHEEIDRLVVIL